MRCQAIKNEAKGLCRLLLWAGNSEAALLGCTSMVRQVLIFQRLQNIPQLSRCKELYEWAHSVLFKRQCSVCWGGLGESGLPSPSPSPVGTGRWQRTVVGSHISIGFSCLWRDHVSRAGWQHCGLAKSRHRVDTSSRVSGRTSVCRTSTCNYPHTPHELVAKYKEAHDLFKMNWKTRGISFSWKDPFTFHHCRKDVSNMRHLPFGIHNSFSVEDFGWD